MYWVTFLVIFYRWSSEAVLSFLHKSRTHAWVGFGRTPLETEQWMAIYLKTGCFKKSPKKWLRLYQSPITIQVQLPRRWLPRHCEHNHRPWLTVRLKGRLHAVIAVHVADPQFRCQEWSRPYRAAVRGWARPMRPRFPDALKQGRLPSVNHPFLALQNSGC